MNRWKKVEQINIWFKEDCGGGGDKKILYESFESDRGFYDDNPNNKKYIVYVNYKFISGGILIETEEDYIYFYPNSNINGLEIVPIGDDQYQWERELKNTKKRYNERNKN